MTSRMTSSWHFLKIGGYPFVHLYVLAIIIVYLLKLLPMYTNTYVLHGFI